MWLIRKQNLDKAPFGFKKSLALSEAFFCPSRSDDRTIRGFRALRLSSVEAFVLSDESFEISRAQAA
jgi:hypothetical protein